MTPEILFFFSKDPAALPLYEAFEARVLAEIDNVAVKVQKTQITYGNPKVFACVSLPRKKGEVGVLVSLGLGRREASPRVAVAVEPYPGRWTNHIPVRTPEEVDAQLLNWVEEAFHFALTKGK